MTTKKVLGGVLLGAMMSVGCAGGSTAATTAELGYVSEAIDGRSDLYIDTAQSHFLLTADEVNGSPTAIQVRVTFTADDMILTRVTGASAGQVLAQLPIVDSVPAEDVVVEAIDGRVAPPGGTTVVIPPSQVSRFGGQGGRTTSAPPIRVTPRYRGILWNPVNNNGIPNETDPTLLGNIANAHPGCA
jgi:hypothetical protein